MRCMPHHLRTLDIGINYLRGNGTSAPIEPTWIRAVYIPARSTGGFIFMATDYSDYEFLKVEVRDRVATITINRPDSLNAVNNVVHHELEQIWIALRADPHVNPTTSTPSAPPPSPPAHVKRTPPRTL